jgi:hypothetical protein
LAAGASAGGVAGGVAGSAAGGVAGGGVAGSVIGAGVTWFSVSCGPVGIVLLPKKMKAPTTKTRAATIIAMVVLLEPSFALLVQGSGFLSFAFMVRILSVFDTAFETHHSKIGSAFSADG